MLMLSHKRHKTKAQKSFYFHQQLTVSTFHHLLVALEAGFASNVVGLFKHISLSSEKKCLFK
jgi:predicted xylose isomerase-like sugar epimerase